MGRTIHCDASCEAHFNTQTNNLGGHSAFATGLLIGHWGTQRDYVLLAIPTPAQEDTGAQSWSQVNHEWVAEHARQVQRMCPGGIDVIGVYCIDGTGTPVDKKLYHLAREAAQSVALPFAKLVNADAPRDFVLLHFNPVKQSTTARTASYPGPTAPPKPADCKYISALTTSHFETLTSVVSVSFELPLAPTDSRNDVSVQDRIERTLSSWIPSIWDALAVDASTGNVIDPDDVDSGTKGAPLSKLVASHSTPLSVSLFATPVTALKGGPQGALDARFRLADGGIYATAFMPSKESAGAAVLALKMDVIRSIWYRCELLIEDEERENPETQLVHSTEVTRDAHWTLPSRHVVVISNVPLSDYKAVRDSDEDLRERIEELVSGDVAIAVEAVEGDAAAAPSAGNGSAPRGKGSARGSAPSTAVSQGSVGEGGKSTGQGVRTQGGAGVGVIGAGVAAVAALAYGVSQMWS
eukprot:TRINITY_DN6214_c0_g1_i2.p1 TRINITY_DN6214_c0_g1~~TRINITY_DN6214_c0_g1_i2.p1  ORF type:complete len:467 (+),score=68.44 TRINITY_DN6214_c0_g1_i2:140-1540(+)